MDRVPHVSKLTWLGGLHKHFWPLSDLYDILQTETFTKLKVSFFIKKSLVCVDDDDVAVSK